MKKIAIVGSGIVGTTIAHALVGRGHQVDLFEKGPEYPYPHRDQWAERILYLVNNTSYQLPRDLRRVTSTGDYAHDLGAEVIQRVGGQATVWGAMSDRLHPHDFQVRSRYGFGVDWPIGYDELEPFYLRAERLLGVSGTVAADDPFAPPRSQPYPLPPFELSWDAQRLAERLRAAGLTLTTSPQARTRAAWDGRPPCANTNACETCPIGARYSPNHHLQQAMATGRLRLHANTTVRSVLLDGSGPSARARALVVRPNGGGGEREHAADLIVLAGGAIETARLLLLSSTPAHPQGLGNASGHLGQHLLFHHFWGAHLDFDEDLFAGRVGPEMGQSRQFADPEGRGKHGGLLWQLPSVSAIDWHYSKGDQAKWTSGAEVMKSLAGLPRCEAVGLHAESAPSPDKHLQLSSEKDRFGDPFAHVHYRSSAFDHETYAFARGVLERIAKAARAVHWEMADAGAASSGYHHMGGCRMSRDPRDGVTDSFGRVHGIPGLVVAGGATFPGSGAVHPTLTMVALALRTADLLAS